MRNTPLPIPLFLVPDRVLAEEVDEVTANQVLHYYSGGEGYPAGSFVQYLIQSAAHADSGNLSKLSIAFPAVASAVALASQKEQGLDVLRALAKGECYNQEERES